MMNKNFHCCNVYSNKSGPNKVFNIPFLFITCFIKIEVTFYKQMILKQYQKKCITLLKYLNFPDRLESVNMRKPSPSGVPKCVLTT